MTAFAPTAGQATAPPSMGGDPYAIANGGVSLNEIPADVRDKLKQAQIDRRRFEPVWQLCQSFLQNRQWVGWDYHDRRIVQLPNPDDRVRVTVNVLTQYHWTFLGKLTSDDLKPDITFRRDDPISRAYARQARRSFEFGWDEESEGDDIVLEALGSLSAFGLGAIRCRPDPAFGELVGNFPVDGEGRMHVKDGDKFAADNYSGDGGPGFTTGPLHAGRLALDPLNPFNILPPPGIAHERDFPHVFVERPVAISQLEMIYGEKAKNLREETMRAIDMIGVREDAGIATGGTYSGMLKGHVRLFTYFEFPTRQHAQGQMMVFAGNTLLDGPKPLPFTVRGQGRAGLVFLKYHPVPGRFWPIGVIEPLIGPQKQRNRARSQWIEMKDRAGLGRVFAMKGSITSVNKPKGGVFELVEVLPGHDMPKETQGVAPGEWLQAEVAQNDNDLDRVAGLREVSLGQAPAGVSAYSAFALLAEQDDRRVGPVLKHIRLELGKLAKIYVCGMRTYWLPQKRIDVAGDDPDDLLDSFLFDSSKLPPEVYVKIGKGAPLPTSQAAEAQKIFDVFDRAISSGQVQPIDWLVDSLQAGKMEPLPKKEPQMQLDRADLENALMAHGTAVQVAPYDDDEMHVQRHRLVQESLSFVPSMQPIVEMVEQHIQEHLASSQAKQQQQGNLAAGMQSQSNPGGFGAQGAAASAGAIGNDANSQQQPWQMQLALRNTNRLSPRPGSVDVAGR